MRDFRDAKSMAHMLREALAAKQHKITVGESLELIAHLFGASDWNTLSASIKNSDRDPIRADARAQGDAPRFAPTTEATLFGAIHAAEARGQTESTVEHLLLALTEDPDAKAIMKAHGVNPAAIRESLSRSLGSENPVERRNMIRNLINPQPTPAFERVVQRAILDGQALGERDITGAHLLGAILAEQEGGAVGILRERGLDRGHVVKPADRRTG